MNALTRSQQDYLKALYALEPQGGPVATSRLAARLGVSAPSVTAMLGKLARTKLVDYEPRGGARLSPSGRRQAIETIRRHRILETFLVNILGLDWSEVHADAEILEHHVSDRVLEALDRVMGHPAEDPHGHPIPDAQGRVRARRLSPLASLAAGRRAVVREVPERARARMERWKRAGLVPGATVRVHAVREADGVLELEVGGRRWVSAGEALAGVMVEPVGANARSAKS
jgi:DtxR family Mn-dependent transcriptional regulator